MSHRSLLFSEFPEISPHCVTIFVDVDVSLYSVSKHLGSSLKITRILYPLGKGQACLSEEFELELSSFSNRIDVFCLLIWRCLNVKSSLSRTDGSEGKVYKKVTVANLALCEKNGRSNPALGGAFLHSFGLGGGNLNEPILKRSNARRVTRKGM